MGRMEKRINGGIGMVGESPAVEMMLSSGGKVVFTISETKDTEKVLLSYQLCL
jgi:hypothetical protein